MEMKIITELKQENPKTEIFFGMYSDGKEGGSDGKEGSKDNDGLYVNFADGASLNDIDYKF